MRTKREAMISKAEELVGSGYIYGATGWICTQERIGQQARQYPEYARLIRRYGPVWLGKPCYDCAQLTRAVAAQAGIRLPSGTSSQWRSWGAWKEMGRLDSLPDEAGLFLYTQSGSRMTHAGVSVGGGEEIDARGHAYGVVRRRIEDTTFTHWARLAVDYDTPEDEPNPQTEEEARRTLRSGMSGEDVARLQAQLEALGYSLSPYGADGRFGAVTRAAVRAFQRDNALDADGIAGRLTYRALDSFARA